MTGSIKSFMKSRTAIIAYITVIVLVFFGIWNEGFLGADNIKSLLLSMSTIGLVGIGISLLLISGENDLAAGAEAAIGGIVAALLIQAGVPWPVAVIIALLSGVFMGLVLAFLVNKAGLMTFIASISMISVYQGVARILTASQNISIDEKHTAFFSLGSGTVLGIIPVPFFIMVVLMAVYGIILYSTEFGRSIYMCGGNRRAARLSGIKRNKITTILFINNSALAALTGILVTARMHNASPTACGTTAVDAITAAVLGGVSFMGGAGNMGCCFIGALLLNIFNSGLTASGLGAYWQVVMQGLLLLLALAVDFFNQKAREKDI